MILAGLMQLRAAAAVGKSLAGLHDVPRYGPEATLLRRDAHVFVNKMSQIQGVSGAKYPRRGPVPPAIGEIAETGFK
jgi:hypothetical protein